MGAILLVVICLSALVMFRTTLTKNMHIRAIRECSRRSDKMLCECGDTLPDPEEYIRAYVLYRAHDFSVDTLDLRKWTYAQYFPELPETQDAEA